MLVSLMTPSLQTHYTKLIHDSLDELAKEHPRDPELIQVRYAYDLDLAVIAARLGASEEAAKKRVQRAACRLQEIVTRLAAAPCSDPPGHDPARLTEP